MIAKSAIHRVVTALAIGGAVVSVSTAAQATSYDQTNLVTDGSVPGLTAAHTDPNLVNPWGVAFVPGNPFWVADNGTGLATLYDRTGAIIPLVPTIPLPPSSTEDHAAPTGQVANTSKKFKMTVKGKTASAIFIFSSENGTISGWNPTVDPNAVLVVDRSTLDRGAVYKGLAIATFETHHYLYATDFRNARIDVFDEQFQPVDDFPFTDPDLPQHYAPFNIVKIASSLYVSYAVQDKFKEDDVAGNGHGIIDEYSLDGKLIRRFATGGGLNSPWGMVHAPAGFGAGPNRLLVGNFGNGWINVFDIVTGAEVGFLKTPAGDPVAIEGLWSLFTDPTGKTGDLKTVYFTAGPNDEKAGLFGKLAPHSAP